MFDAVPDWPEDQVLNWVSAATPNVIEEIGSIVEAAQRVADEIARRGSRAEQLTDSKHSSVRCLDPREAIAAAVSAACDRAKRQANA
jgi:hypothetical protein